MKEGINDWGLNYNIDYPVSDSRQRTNEKETFSVKLCPKCNTAFENIKDVYQDKIDTLYYTDFYRRGLYKETCPTCKPKEKNNGKSK